MPDKESIIYDYVKAQYETEKQLSQVLDTRIANYLVITGLFWGILIQATSGFFRLNKVFYSHHSFILNIVWVVYFLANSCLLIAIIWVLILFTQMRYLIPIVDNKDNYIKVIKSSLTDSKEVMESFIGNYIFSYKENLIGRKKRGKYFWIIRASILTGVVSTVIFVSTYGFLKINWEDKKMSDETTNTSVPADKPEVKPVVAQGADYIELGNSKNDVKPVVTQGANKINLGESKEQK